MAIEFVRGKINEPGTAEVNFAAAATAGNLLVCFIDKRNTEEAKPKDNKGGAWTVHATHSLSKEGSCWVAYKVAEGGEEKIKEEGTNPNQLIYAELKGASTTVDAIANVDKIASAKTGTVELTTTDANSIVLCSCADSAALSMGKPEAWTNLALANIEEPATNRAFVGWKVMTETLTAKKITANHATAREKGLLAIAFKPSATVANLAATLTTSEVVVSPLTQAQGPKATLTTSGALTIPLQEKVGLQTALGLVVTIAPTARQVQALATALGVTITAKAALEAAAELGANLAATTGLVMGIVATLTQAQAIAATTGLKLAATAALHAEVGGGRKVAIFIFDE